MSHESSSKEEEEGKEGEEGVASGLMLLPSTVERNWMDPSLTACSTGSF